jgi:hypothetical protein
VFDTPRAINRMRHITTDPDASIGKQAMIDYA